MYTDRITISEFYSRIVDKISSEILGEKDSFIIGTSIDELVEYYYSENHLDPIEFDPNNEPSWEHGKAPRIVRSHQREIPYRGGGDIEYEFETITVTVPIVPNRHLETIMKLNTSTIIISGWSSSKLIYSNDSIKSTFDIKGYYFNKTDDQITAEINKEIDEIKALLERMVKYRARMKHLKGKLGLFLRTGNGN